MWDPAQYLRYGNERSRPFFDLTGRIATEQPAEVTDLGCGPGHLTAALARRWPAAQVHGIDSDAEMIAAARQEPAGANLRFSAGDVRDWQPQRAQDVIVSNAVLQWVPGHLDLLPQWAGALAPGGTLAFQLPGNFDQPSHVVMRQMAATPRWQPLLAGAQLNRQAGALDAYAGVLGQAGCTIDAWETTYLHILPGEDAVLDWYRGSGLRPVLAALGPDDSAEFLAEYGAAMRAAYPPTPLGTLFPFRRLFVVARRS